MTDSIDTGFTHFDNAGNSQMVDVSDKDETHREAVAEATVLMHRETRSKIEQQAMKKGDVLAVSELAGIMAAKKTADLIPLCHPLPLTKVSVVCNWIPDDDAPARATDTTNSATPSSTPKARLHIEATVKTTYRTGVEMEALTACSVAALTVYDMCKAVDKDMSITSLQLLHKSGGRSGIYNRSHELR